MFTLGVLVVSLVSHGPREVDQVLMSLVGAQLGLGKEESAEVPTLVRSKVSFEASTHHLIRIN